MKKGRKIKERKRKEGDIKTGMKEEKKRKGRKARVYTRD